MEEKKSNAGQGLGIAGLVLGIIALLISFIPCVGLFALVPGAIAIVLSAIALMQAKKANASKGLIIAALVISILGTSIAAIWGLVLGSAAGGIKGQMDQQVMKDIDKSMKSLEAGKPVSDVDFDKFLADYEKLLTETVKLKEKSKAGNFSSMPAFALATAKVVEVAAKLAEVKPNLSEAQTQKLEELNKKFETDIESLKH